MNHAKLRRYGSKGDYMDNKEKTKGWKYYVGYALSLSAASMVLWPLIGLLTSSLTGTPFVYDLKEHLLYPFAFGILLGAYNFHVDVNRDQ